jgi:hypothetical protein
MSVMAQLAATAFVVSLIVWGAFGYFIAPYLMGRKHLRRLQAPPPPLTVVQNIAAACVVFTSPQVAIIQPAVVAPMFQLPNNMTSNASEITIYRVA